MIPRVQTKRVVFASAQTITYEQYRLFLDNCVLGRTLAFDLHLPKGVTDFFMTLKTDFQNIASQFKVSLNDVVRAFQQRDVYTLLKSVSFNIKLIWKALQMVLSLVHSGLLATFRALEADGWLDKIKSGTYKVDDLLNRHPVLKKLTGLALAGFLLWAWLSMSFTGNFQSDFDLTYIVLAFKGQFSLTDLFASADGLLLISAIAAGLFTGIGFTWLTSNTANLILAIVYTGASKLKISKLHNRAIERLMHPIRL